MFNIEFPFQRVGILPAGLGCFVHSALAPYSTGGRVNFWLPKQRKITPPHPPKGLGLGGRQGTYPVE